MSELGNRIRGLRAGMSQPEFAQNVGLSLRTICKLEAGESVRLDTIRQIAEKLELPESERLELIISWLRLELAEDFPKLIVEIRDHPSTAREKDHLPAQIQLLVNNIPHRFQEQIYLALQRPEVLRCLPPLNEMFASLKKQSSDKK